MDWLGQLLFLCGVRSYILDQVCFLPVKELKGGKISSAGQAGRSQTWQTESASEERLSLGVKKHREQDSLQSRGRGVGGAGSLTYILSLKAWGFKGHYPPI